MPSEYMTLNEAAEAINVSRATLWRRIQQDNLQTYQSQQDRRVRLLKRADVEALMQPRPVIHTPRPLEGKRAA